MNVSQKTPFFLTHLKLTLPALCLTFVIVFRISLLANICNWYFLMFFRTLQVTDNSTYHISTYNFYYISGDHYLQIFRDITTYKYFYKCTLIFRTPLLAIFLQIFSIFSLGHQYLIFSYIFDGNHCSHIFLEIFSNFSQHQGGIKCASWRAGLIDSEGSHQ